MSETPNNRPSNTNRRPRKPTPNTANAAAGDQAQNGRPKRRPAQKPRRPQNQNKNAGRGQKTADNYGNQINGNANSNRRTPNGNRPQANGRKPQGQNRNNSWNHHGTDLHGEYDQYRSSDWYREDQARFAQQQIALERAESGEGNKNKRNPKNRSARPQQRNAPRTNGTASTPENTSTESAAEPPSQETPQATNDQAPDNGTTAEASPADNATDSSPAKRDTGKSRRAPWRTQKHATARKSDATKPDNTPTPDE